MEMKTLTGSLLHELIEKIEVSEAEGSGRNRMQRIKICYRFIGYLELPIDYEANVFAIQLKLPDEDVLECVYNGYDIAVTARALHSDINLVALKIAELNRRGYQLREQEYRNKFLKP